MKKYFYLFLSSVNGNSNTAASHKDAADAVALAAAIFKMLKSEVVENRLVKSGSLDMNPSILEFCSLIMTAQLQVLYYERALARAYESNGDCKPSSRSLLSKLAFHIAELNGQASKIAQKFNSKIDSAWKGKKKSIKVCFLFFVSWY
jgi:hypothetical protein